MKFLLCFIASVIVIIPEILAQRVHEDVTDSPEEISGVIYYNNCNFTSQLLGTINDAEGIPNAIPVTSNLPANNSQWVKFDTLQVNNDTVVVLSATSVFETISGTPVPFSFTTNDSSDCNAQVICTGSPLDYSLTFGGLQCFDSDVGTVSVYGLCAGLYLGSEGIQLPCQPGSICTYNNQFDSQCLPISAEAA